MSDYIRFQQIHRAKNANINLAATDGGLSDVLAVRSANHQIYVQKIHYAPVTAAAQTVTFQDDAGSPVKIAVVPASQSTPLTFDFGPTGVPLTLGKNLDISNVAGPAAKIHIEGYERLGAVVAANTNP